ncbi:MAG: hypothetical protein IJK92_03105 [Bacteroidales bacterium]|nr:hypothetical protein [Bacteroidales bacterium]
MERQDIDFVEGSVNPGGMGNELYYAFKRDIASMPTITDDFALAADEEAFAVYTGNITMKTGKKFARVYNTQGEGSVDFESAGEPDGKMFKNKLSFKYPKVTDKMRAFAKATLNSNVIYVVKSAGLFYVIGHPDYPITTTPGGTSGKKADDAHGINIEVEALDCTPLPRYEGTLPLSDGSLNCETGVFTPTEANAH